MPTEVGEADVFSVGGGIAELMATDEE